MLDVSEVSILEARLLRAKFFNGYPKFYRWLRELMQDPMRYKDELNQPTNPTD